MESLLDLYRRCYSLHMLWPIRFLFISHEWLQSLCIGLKQRSPTPNTVTPHRQSTRCYYAKCAVHRGLTLWHFLCRKCENATFPPYWPPFTGSLCALWQIFKILVFFIQTTKPPGLLKPHIPLKSDDHLLMVIPRTTLKRRGACAFLQSQLKLWSGFPL